VAGQMCVGAGSVHAAAPVLAEHSCYYMLLRFGALVVRVRAIGLRRIRARRASLFACWAGSGSRPLNADMSASRPAHALCHAGMPVHGRCARTTRAWKHANNTARCRSWTRAASSGPWPTCGPGGPRAAAATLTSHHAAAPRASAPPAPARLAWTAPRLYRVVSGTLPACDFPRMADCFAVFDSEQAASKLAFQA